ncbi:MAG: YbjN domain-containing protein [Lachnospiraceae bacterium]|nr:YbjN domain-containing protein [Lachnospiraceae bacterium]
MATALELLRDRLMEDTVELSYDNIDGIPTLRVVLDSMGVDEDGLVVAEISNIPVEEDTKYGYYHFMCILANKLEDSQVSETLVNLNRINMETLLGAYSVITEAGTVVHKYVLRTQEEKAEETADAIYSCLVDIVSIINNDYDRVLSAIAE